MFRVDWGLNLHIAKSYIKILDGEIGVESEGEGKEIHFTLRCRQNNFNNLRKYERERSKGIYVYCSAASPIFRIFVLIS